MKRDVCRSEFVERMKLAVKVSTFYTHPWWSRDVFFLTRHHLEASGPSPSRMRSPFSRYISRTTGGRDLILTYMDGPWDLQSPPHILAIRLRMRSTFLVLSREPLWVET
ncbi:hypothetical protein AVEN_227364-1 [Araneus ventricosus]|uniref:Uncharacterized protein n=1 Tax=Araneus ventricosus TaxID=182803 RepID=A0A4Y2GSB3_ARAVE|nr:hypothetical protein AVEN_227364-1 [Araneus ventricosus]